MLLFLRWGADVSMLMFHVVCLFVLCVAFCGLEGLWDVRWFV